MESENRVTTTSNDEQIIKDSKREETKEEKEEKDAVEEIEEDEDDENEEETEEPNELEKFSIEELEEQSKTFMKNKEYQKATEVYSEILSRNVAKHGELGDECGETYFKYGKALLLQAQSQVDILGGKIKKDMTKDEVEDDEDDHKGALGESADNMELAWEVIEIARVIFSKNPKRKSELADVHIFLGDLSLEADNMAHAISEYTQCLKIRQDILPSDDIKLVDVQFLIGIAYQMDNKMKEALTHFEAAVKILESRMNNKREGDTEEDITEWNQILTELSLKIEELKNPIRIKKVESTSTFSKPTMAVNTTEIKTLEIKTKRKIETVSVDNSTLPDQTEKKVKV